MRISQNPGRDGTVARGVRRDDGEGLAIDAAVSDSRRVSAVARYPRGLRVLHWVMALGLVLQGALGWMAETLRERDLAALAMQAHVQLGLLLLFLLALRIVLRRRMRRATPTSHPGLRERVAGGVHRLLYLLMLALPLSGAVIFVHLLQPISVLGLVRVPALLASVPEDETLRALAWYLHVYGAWLLFALAALHAGAALWHQCVRGDGAITRRMGLGAE